MVGALNIGPMQLYHVPMIAEIERLCFTEPWSENGIYRMSIAEGSRFVVATLDDDAVVGYVGMMSVLDEGYIANVAVHPDYRRRGIARAVIRHIAEEARQMGLGFITLEVRVSNAAAIALYTSEGFSIEGTRPGYYDYPKEDALIMTRRFEVG